MINLILLTIMTLIPITTLATDHYVAQYEIAVKQCLKGSQEGFFAAKSLLIHYQDQPELQNFLKEMMCYCKFTPNIEKDLNEVADDIIQHSDRPLAVGIAWFQKSRISSYKKDYSTTILYSEKALEHLGKAKSEAKQGNISFKEIFEASTHILRRNTFEKLGETDKCEAEREIIKTYTWTKKI